MGQFRISKHLLLTQSLSSIPWHKPRVERYLLGEYNIALACYNMRRYKSLPTTIIFCLCIQIQSRFVIMIFITARYERNSQLKITITAKNVLSNYYEHQKISDYITRNLMADSVFIGLLYIYLSIYIYIYIHMLFSFWRYACVGDWHLAETRH